MKKIYLTVSILFLIIFNSARADIEVDGQKIYLKNSNSDYQIRNVKDINDIDDIETIPIFTPEKPLPKKDMKGVKFSKEWQKSNNFVMKESNGRTSFYYGAGQPTVVCSPLQLCVIELEKGEQIVEGGVQIGDGTRWKLDLVVGNNKTYNLILKPLDVSLKTSLVILSDKRIYHINLISRKTDFMALVSFRYPQNLQNKIVNFEANNAQETKIAIENNRKLEIERELAKKHLDFDYEISECELCLWKPIRVYNDGQQTFIQMNKLMGQVEAPALVILGSGRDSQEITNYRVHDNLYIVDKLFTRAKLISGIGVNAKTIEIEYKGFKR